jgi:hypothetical protein
MDELLRQLLAADTARLLAICKANDRNGEFELCTRDEMVCMILEWATLDTDTEGDLRFLLGLAR